MLEMLRRTRSTFRLDEEACAEYQGRCYTTYMEDPKPRRTIPEPRSIIPEPRTTVQEPRSTVPKSTVKKPRSSTPDPKSTAPEPKPKISTIPDPKGFFKPVEVNPVGLGILIEHGGRESKVCIKPISIQTFPKKVTSLSNKPSSSFLKACHLCKKKLVPDKDIYMYRGDLGFCTIECRSRQIFLDEMEERERFVKANAALAPRCRRRSDQIPQADQRRGVLAMA